MKTSSFLLDTNGESLTILRYMREQLELCLSSQTPHNQKKKGSIWVLGLRDGLFAVCNYVIGDYRQGGTGLFSEVPSDTL